VVDVVVVVVVVSDKDQAVVSIGDHMEILPVVHVVVIIDQMLTLTKLISTINLIFPLLQNHKINIKILFLN